jgi:hypothetical protein
MTEDPGNPKPHRPKHPLARAIGGAIGCATALAVGRLIGFESFWLGVVLVAGCTGIGILLAQKISGEI